MCRSTNSRQRIITSFDESTRDDARTRRRAPDRVARCRARRRASRRRWLGARAATRDARGATTTTRDDDATRRRRRATTEARDDGQRRALDALERFYDGARLGTRAGRGVYLHGGVGRGKTALADATSEDAREKGGLEVERTHFHAFMARIHRALHESAMKARGEGEGGADPLWTLGKNMATKTRQHVLCLDEMEISDVADAMVIERLMRSYFAHGGALVTKSNCAPERLYYGGINRAAFAGFADGLRARCEVVDLDARESVDYRRRARDEDVEDGVIFVGDDDATRERLSRAWDRFTRDAEGEREVDADVGRLRAKARVGAHARFTFDDICGRRSRAAPSDYVALAERFKVICVEDVPRLPVDASENEARRFINLIDVLYEHRVVLLANLWTSPDDLFDVVDGAVDDSDAFRELAPRERTRIENAFQSTLSVTRDGGSSGRSTTMLAPELEWSATGRVGASLAHVSGVNFTLAASPRAASRLHHMRSSAYFNTSP